MSNKLDLCQEKAKEWTQKERMALWKKSKRAKNILIRIYILKRIKIQVYHVIRLYTKSDIGTFFFLSLYI